MIQITDFVNGPEEEILTLSRTYNAPRDLVFKVWTECEHMSGWWGPKGWSLSYCKIDLRPGGLFHYCMRGPNGDEHWGRFVYHEIVVPERLVFINSFADAYGGLEKVPFMPDWPREVLAMVTFTEEDGKTTITFEAAPVNASDNERKIFIGGKEQFGSGWGSSLEKLEEYLPNAR